VSIRLMSAVFENRELGPTERLIMLALADHCDDEGRCYPSIARLCQRTGLSERAVQINTRKLVEAGYIRIALGGGKGNANLYFVSANPAPDAPRTKCTPAPDAPQTPHLVRSNPAPDAPEPSLTTIGTVSIKEADASLMNAREKPPPKRGCQLPENWVPSDRNISDAEAREFTGDQINEQADAFRDYHRARGTTFKDWDAAWRTWLGNARRFARPSQASRPGPSGAHHGLFAGFQRAAAKLPN
jgi:hypothetical protein